jgi:hypothetical protein
LVAKIDEGHCFTLATEFEPEKATVELQRLLYIADLQGYVVQSNGTRFYWLCHRGAPLILQ